MRWDKEGDGNDREKGRREGRKKRRMRRNEG